MDFKSLKQMPQPVPPQPGSLRDILLKSNKLNPSLNTAVAVSNIAENIPFTSVIVKADSSATPNVLGVQFNKIAGDIYTAHDVSLKNLESMVKDRSIVFIAKGDRVYPIGSPAP